MITHSDPADVAGDPEREVHAEDPLSLPEIFDWTPFHEVEQALGRLAGLVLVRWRPRNASTHEPPVAGEVQDALLDLRPLVREATAIWRRLGRYVPEDEAGREVQS